MENIIQTGLKIFKPNKYLNHNIYKVYETEKNSNVIECVNCSVRSHNYD